MSVHAPKAPPLDASARERPLAGLRVLELGQLLAGPFAGTMLGYFGADVIKVEPPGGDPLRTWRGMAGDTSVWWRSLSRNKRCMVLDLRQEQGRALARELALGSDVLLENFRPGTMEGWGLGPDTLRAMHPGLIYVRISGFGQTGPYRSRAGLASVCEATAGLRYITGPAEGPSVRSNISLGDSLGGLHATIGLLLALLVKERTGQGQVVDVALTESVLNVMEAIMPEYHALGIVRQPSGATITGVVPSNVYPCADGRVVVLGANTGSLFRRLVLAMGRQDLADDASLLDNRARVARSAEIDEAIAAWTGSLPSNAVVETLAAQGVPCGPVHDAAGVAADPHFTARGLWESVGQDTLPALAPKLEGTPGRTDWAGPALGAHTDEVLRERLRLDPDAIAALRRSGIVA